MSAGRSRQVEPTLCRGQLAQDQSGHAADQTGYRKYPWAKRWTLPAEPAAIPCYLAEAGFQVDAIDISHQGFAANPAKGGRCESLRSTASSMTSMILTSSTSDYDLILVLWYVNLPLIKQALRLPGKRRLPALRGAPAQRTRRSSVPATRTFASLPGALRDAVSHHSNCSAV